MATYKVDALILKKRNYQEADRIVTIFGRGTGKESVRAKGVRKLKSKLAGHLETFSRSDLVVAEGKGFDLVTQAQLRESYPNIRSDFAKMAEGFYIFELLDKVTPEGYKDSHLFDFVVNFLRALEAATSTKLDNIRFSMELQLLDTLGFRPQLKTCATCEKKLLEGAFFNTFDVLFYCAQHIPQNNRGFHVSLNALKSLVFFSDAPFEKSEQLEMPRETRKEIENILQNLISQLSEKRINAKRLLSK